MLVSSQLPRWLEGLLTQKFFNACVIHEEAKKNEKNVYCLDCCFSLCPHCLPPHSSHRLLQIRRYVYHDVIKLGDAHKLFDCSFVQSYTTNGAKVLFLNPRPQTRPFRNAGSICFSCDRNLQESCLFCSLFCKIDHLLRTQSEGGLSKFLLDCKFLTLSEPVLDDGLMTPDSVLDPASSTKTSSGSGESSGGVVCRTEWCTATTEIARKKRSSLPKFPPVSEISVGFMNRRKKNPQPHRSPLY
ncbi:hypothetical protein HS088_TW08G00905 [Tripterygium wilfordii]|uniref:PLATZ transcription factor family protein n=1 Tax=Tripterygium wilfordii TaxID=458696 RepID=A0A7J7DD48_TRIWF|nr:uncharacterized protein LOC120004372 isoform X1 [Tripterygium wilfordii]XP_038709636.1 uncharacterized protein LOC120004372 isoform X2 [Tripterygium wilfordii]KAF5744305.1 hypothetical protein HS088_TW08G00905 [Tripterygium wilfordii]